MHTPGAAEDIKLPGDHKEGFPEEVIFEPSLEG